MDVRPRQNPGYRTSFWLRSIKVMHQALNLGNAARYRAGLFIGSWGKVSCRVNICTMKNGDYEMVKAPDDYPGRTYRGSRRYVYEHHLVWWQHTGGVVPCGLVIHHRNGKKRDNRFQNLELKEHALHSSEHALRVPEVAAECDHCGITFSIKPAEYRKRSARTKSGAVYCSRSCGKSASWSRGDEH